MSISSLAVQGASKPSDFIKISWVDKLLPDYFSVLRFLSVTDFSVIKSTARETLLPVDLLRGVDLSKNKFVTLLGVVVCGVWTVPEGCRGGATVGLIDTRMHNIHEGTICKFSAAASVRDFQVKFIPNYSITAADASRNPWKMFVRVSGVDIKEGFSPLSLEIACLVATSNSIFKKGLRVAVKEFAISSDAAVAVDSISSHVEPFFDAVPITRSVVEFDKSYRRPVSNVRQTGNAVQRGRVGKSSSKNSRKGDSTDAASEASGFDFSDGLLSDHS